MSDEEELQYLTLSLGLTILPYVVSYYVYKNFSPVVGMVMFTNYMICEYSYSIKHTILKEYWKLKLKRSYKKCHKILDEKKEMKLSLKESPSVEEMRSYSERMVQTKIEIDKSLAPFLKASEKVAFHQEMEEQQEKMMLEMLTEGRHDVTFHKTSYVIVAVSFLVSTGMLRYF